LPDLVATPDDFKFAWQSRKAELLKQWRTDADLNNFWEADLGLGASHTKLRKLQKQADVSDAEFCELCQEFQKWLPGENKRRRKAGKELIPRNTIGLRAGENYFDPADAPRIATIYNGLYGRAQFVPFRKGDPEGISGWIMTRFSLIGQITQFMKFRTTRKLVGRDKNIFLRTVFHGLAVQITFR